MSITINDESALIAFKAEILKSLSPEQREQILSLAVEKVMALGKDRYQSVDYRNDLLNTAIAKVMGETIQSILQESEHKAKLDAAARQVIDKVMAAIGETLVEAVEKTIRGY